MRYYARQARDAILFLCAFDPPCKLDMRVGCYLGGLWGADIGCCYDEREGRSWRCGEKCTKDVGTNTRRSGIMLMDGSKLEYWGRAVGYKL